jgi:hypothetical protein
MLVWSGLTCRHKAHVESEYAKIINKLKGNKIIFVLRKLKFKYFGTLKYGMVQKPYFKNYFSSTYFLNQI